MAPRRTNRRGITFRKLHRGQDNRGWRETQQHIEALKKEILEGIKKNAIRGEAK